MGVDLIHGNPKNGYFFTSKWGVDLYMTKYGNHEFCILDFGLISWGDLYLGGLYSEVYYSLVSI